MKLLFANMILVLLASSTMLAASYSPSLASTEPRLATKLGRDSTIFTLSLDGKHPPKPGKTFQIKIHVAPGGDWHVYSSKMSSEGGLTPLTLSVPTEISEYFEVTNITETGDIRTGYDSNFMAVTMAHYTPFDIVATIKVKKKTKDEVPFYLLLHYQTCNETMCMPPRTFAVPMTVLGAQPIKLRIAGVMKRPQLRLASLNEPK